MALEAGVGVRDVSPVKSLHLCGYPHVERNATGVHDPLLASALCLRNRGSAVILVAVDIVGLDTPTAARLRRAIANEAGVPEAHVFISCSHTHSGPHVADYLMYRDDPAIPPCDREYKRFLEEGIRCAALESTRSMHPAECACTTADASGVGGNRHDPQGTADTEAGIIAVRHAVDKHMIALSLTYSMHPTVLHEDSTLVSSDFPGYARLHLKEKLGGALVVLYHTGPSGNQSPRWFVKGQTFNEAERLGRLLGERVAASVGCLADGDFSRDVALWGKLRKLDLTPKGFPPVDEARAHLQHCRAEYERLKREDAGHGPIRTAECTVFGAEHMLFLAACQARGEIEKSLGDYLPACVQVVRIGDCRLAGLPGEFFVEYGLAVKEGSPHTVFVVSLVNGNLQGYIVTEEAVAGRGYEACTGMFPPAAGREIVEAVLAMIRAGDD